MFNVSRFSIAPKTSTPVSTQIARLNWDTTNPPNFDDGYGNIPPYTAGMYVYLPDSAGPTTVDNFTLASSWDLPHWIDTADGLPIGTRNISSRYPRQIELGGNDNNMYSIWYFAKATTIQAYNKLKTTFYLRCPSVGFNNYIQDTIIPQVWFWGQSWVSIDYDTTGPANIIRIGHGALNNDLRSSFYTFPTNAWYKIDIDCYKNTVDGYISLTVSTYNGLSPVTLRYDGNTGTATESLPITDLGSTSNFIVLNKSAYLVAANTVNAFSRIADITIYSMV